MKAVFDTNILNNRFDEIETGRDEIAKRKSQIQPPYFVKRFPSPSP